MSFVKLHGTILDSSVWSLPSSTRIVWIAMLAMADEDGVVSASVSGLARRAVVSIDECNTALDIFLSPDPDSRDGTTGERIEKIPGGWLIVNHAQYRDRETTTRLQARERVRRHREKRALHTVTVTDSALHTVTGALPSASASVSASSGKEGGMGGEKQDPAPVVRSGSPPLILAWNEILAGSPIPLVKNETKSRLDKIRSRMSEHPDMDWWRGVIAKIKSAPFLRGENDRGWRANFDWLVRSEDNATKVMEGVYEKARGGRYADVT